VADGAALPVSVRAAVTAREGPYFTPATFRFLRDLRRNNSRGHPDADALRRIRERIVEEPAAWRGACRDKAFARAFQLEGDRLARPPKGFGREHPMAEDLKWKDYIGVASFDDAFVTHLHLTRQLSKQFAAGTPFVRFLCDALGVPF
jgi:uncharacterized protein (TIGR02453 family)